MDEKKILEKQNNILMFHIFVWTVIMVQHNPMQETYK